jgi:hypothetical protein
VSTRARDPSDTHNRKKGEGAADTGGRAARKMERGDEERNNGGAHDEEKKKRRGKQEKEKRDEKDLRRPRVDAEIEERQIEERRCRKEEALERMSQKLGRLIAEKEQKEKEEWDGEERQKRPQEEERRKAQAAREDTARVRGRAWSPIAPRHHLTIRTHT